MTVLIKGSIRITAGQPITVIIGGSIAHMYHQQMVDWDTIIRTMTLRVFNINSKQMP